MTFRLPHTHKHTHNILARILGRHWLWDLTAGTTLGVGGGHCMYRITKTIKTKEEKEKKTKKTITSSYSNVRPYLSFSHPLCCDIYLSTHSGYLRKHARTSVKNSRVYFPIHSPSHIGLSSHSSKLYEM